MLLKLRYSNLGNLLKTHTFHTTAIINERTTRTHDETHDCNLEDTYTTYLSRRRNNRFIIICARDIQSRLGVSVNAHARVITRTENSQMMPCAPAT